MTHEAEFSTYIRVSRSGDTTVPIISGTCANSVCSSLPQHGPGEQVLVSGCDTGIGCFTDRLEGQEHGSRLRAECTGRDFGDLRVCLRRYSTNWGSRSVSDSRYISTLSPVGKGVI